MLTLYHLRNKMGGFLDKPKIEKSHECGEGNGVKYGVVSMQGWRVEMEDAHSAVTSLPDEFSGKLLVLTVQCLKTLGTFVMLEFELQIGHILVSMMDTVGLVCLPIVLRIYYLPLYKQMCLRRYHQR